MLRPSGKEKAAEQLLRVRSLQSGRALHALQDRAAQIELELLLREVSRYDAVSEAHRSTLCGALVEDRFEQRRLAGSVRPDERDVLATFDCEARALE